MKEYYINDKGRQKGPINEAKLQKDVSAGKYATDALVWSEGMADWEPIERHFQLPATPPPLPTGTPPPLPGSAADNTTQPTVPYTYVEAVYSSLIRCFNFKDRASKAECWKAILVFMGLALICPILIPLLILFSVYLLPMCLLASLSVRRMHDIGKPGWFAWIPIYGTILALQDSQAPNQYGEAALKPEELPSILKKQKQPAP